jgi:hypothetical protein
MCLKNDKENHPLFRYQHLTVNHSENFVDPVTGAHTQTVERLWKSAKERNKRQFGTRRAMMESYFIEFIWRRKVKLAAQDPFDAILNAIAQHWAPQ